MNAVTLVTQAADVEAPEDAVFPMSGRRSVAEPRDQSEPKPFLPNPARPLVAEGDDRPTAGGAQASTSKELSGVRWQGDILLVIALCALVGSAWHVSHMGLFKSNDDTSYWIAVTGGSMMLALFSYPLRKYARALAGVGKVKWWFWFHLLMGIGGPWLILVHSGFRSESLNAGVALYSMVIVVLSGVVGLFIYVRVHRGLHGERTSLRALSERAGFVEIDARSRLHFAPQVEARLLAFEQDALRGGWTAHLRRVTILPVQQYITYCRCLLELQQPLKERATRHHWTPSELRRRRRRAHRLVARYLDAVVRVAQFTAFERLFALWHMAHLPFIYLLVISAVVHVVAVHAY